MYFDTTNYFLNKKNDVFLSILVHLKKKKNCVCFLFCKLYCFGMNKDLFMKRKKNYYSQLFSLYQLLS